MSNRSLSMILIALLGAQIVSAILFAMRSDGFYAMVRGGVFKCSDLLSSGRDDEVIMLVFSGLVISVIFRTLRFSRRVSGLEVFVFVGIMGLGLWSILIGSDCGEFGTTLIVTREPYLWIFSASSVLAALMMLYLWGRR